MRRLAPATEKPSRPKLGFQRLREKGPLRSIYDGDLIPRALQGLGHLALYKSSSGPPTTVYQQYQARCRVARKEGLPGLLSPTTASQGHRRENIVNHGRGKALGVATSSTSGPDKDEQPARCHKEEAGG